MNGQSDKDLISDYLKGNEASLGVLINRYLNPIYRFVYQYLRNAADAEEVTQETFVKAWRHIKKFKRDKNFLTWLLAIAKNTAIDFLRKRKSIVFSDFSVQGRFASGGENDEGEGIADVIPDEADLPEEVFKKSDLKLKLKDALDRLPANYRVVLHLHYNEYLALSEIAELLDESVNTIKSRHRRGLMILRRTLVKESL